jgi:hypothetical protein
VLPHRNDGENTGADGETVRAADTAGSTAAFWRASQRAGDRRDSRRRAAAAGLVWPLPPEQTDEALEQLLFPDPRSKPGARRYVEPDWSGLVREMKRPGVNLSVLFEEYRAVNPDGYVYSQFCQRLSASVADDAPDPCGRR